MKSPEPRDTIFDVTGLPICEVANVHEYNAKIGAWRVSTYEGIYGYVAWDETSKHWWLL